MNPIDLLDPGLNENYDGQTWKESILEICLREVHPYLWHDFVVNPQTGHLMLQPSDFELFLSSDLSLGALIMTFSQTLLLTTCEAIY